ncbi:LacI family DNA-binding transcriptional regulator [Kocuria marina]|uniref:LacI family DNA-binding transcriptional regulator n=1 Tax=Kocuria marina TaxID=223184 RepID=UPI0022E77CD0|nr:LacI family DNA-binding transcriptional regulator [Kocuria marina]
MVTSRDVARLAGVSQATVSRVMSSASSITPETRLKVRAAMETLGYVPHAGAQAMKTRRTRTIGAVVKDLTNPFYSEVLDELTRELSQAGYRVVLWNAGADSHHDALSAIRERAVDGVIFTTATEETVELQAALERKSPLVLINRIVKKSDADQVTSDNLAGGAAVADYLHQHGRTRAAFVGGLPEASTSHDRARGFLERMQQLGHPVSEDLRLHADFSHDVSQQATGKLLNRVDPPDAIFCANDYMAFGALDALRTYGLSIPQDCWVIGYDDVDMASWPSFNLTTVRQPSREMAIAGAKMLLNRIAAPDLPPQHLSFACNLIVRGSTGASVS